MIEKLIVAVYGVGVALLLAAVFTVSLPLLTVGGLLVLAVFTAGPLAELRRHEGSRW